MPQNISFVKTIHPVEGNIKNPEKYKHYNMPVKDYFVKSNSGIDEKVSCAKAQIIKTIKNENKEQIFVINPDGSMYTEIGDKDSCNIDKSLIQTGGILVHGHPIKLPLSNPDIIVLLNTDAISQEAVCEDGSYSKLTKKFPFKLDRHTSPSFFELEKQLNKMVLDELGVDYSYDKDDVIMMAVDAFNDRTCDDLTKLSYEEILNYIKKFGIDVQDTENINDITEKIQTPFLLYKMSVEPYKYDKLHQAILDNNDKIQEYLSSKEGIQLQNQFLNNTADKYNLIYETNMV